MRVLYAIALVLASVLSSEGAELYELTTGASKSPPFGSLRFCEDYPQECVGPLKPLVVVFSPEVFRTLLQVNSEVNARVTYKTDAEHWGYADSRYVARESNGMLSVEKWSYPTDGYGDCEDYALEKKRLLVNKGWPRSALLLTLIEPKEGIEKHLVLTVRTTEGDFILDNRYSEVLRWWQLGDSFLYRQTSAYPQAWEHLHEPQITGSR